MTLKETCLVILAAGKSTRMGKPKGLVEINGKSLIQLQAERFLKAGGEQVLFVLGYDFEKYVSHIGAHDTVLNQAPARGQFSSIQMAAEASAGLGQLGYWLMPIDTPCPHRDIFETLLKSSKGKEAVVPTFEDKGGHPIFLTPTFFKALTLFPVDSRLDTILRLSSSVARVEVGWQGVVFNMNTPEEVAGFSALL